MKNLENFKAQVKGNLLDNKQTQLVQGGSDVTTIIMPLVEAAIIISEDVPNIIGATDILEG